MVVQSFIIPKTKQASLLRYEVTGNSKIKAYILLNQYDITSFPHLKYEDIVNKRKNDADADHHTEDEQQYISKAKLDSINNDEIAKYF